jgi:ATP-dependent RNA helicase DHX37/DHR1
VGCRLITGQQHDCLPYVIAIVSALSVGDPFIQDYHLDENQPGESGDEDDDDDGGDDNLDRQELQNLRNQSTLDKQKRKLIRKKYYQSQIVSIRKKKSHFSKVN